ncbi:MAG: hypothetical protein RIR39_2227, partial [Pseudomonadota bacterium]
MQNNALFLKVKDRAPLHEKFSVMSLVVLLHLSVLSGYWLQPESPAVVVNEM